MVKCNINNILLKKIKKQGVKLMDKGEIQAVHYDDMHEFLLSIGEFDKVVNGHAKCYFCGKQINIDDIQSIFPIDNEVKYCCNSENCYRLIIQGGSL